MSNPALFCVNVWRGKKKKMTNIPHQASRLEAVPYDLLNAILLFLDVGTLQHNLRLVSRYFNEMLSEDAIWEMLFKRDAPRAAKEALLSLGHSSPADVMLQFARLMSEMVFSPDVKLQFELTDRGDDIDFHALPQSVADVLEWNNLCNVAYKFASSCKVLQPVEPVKDQKLPQPLWNELMSRIVFPRRFPSFFSGLRRADRVILLFGPPGTGKSLAILQIASELPETDVFCVDCRKLQQARAATVFGSPQKWLEYFAHWSFVLKERCSCILVLDHVDEILVDCLTHVHTTFLFLADHVPENCQLIGICRSPLALVGPQLRRFDHRIPFQLPPLEERDAFLQVTLSRAHYSFAVAEATAGYSFWELGLLCRLAKEVESVAGTDTWFEKARKMVEPTWSSRHSKEVKDFERCVKESVW